MSIWRSMDSSSQKAHFPLSYHLCKHRSWKHFPDSTSAGTLARCHVAMVTLVTVWMTAKAYISYLTEPSRQWWGYVVAMASSGNGHRMVVLFVQSHTAAKWRGFVDCAAESLSELRRPLVMWAHTSVSPLTKCEPCGSLPKTRFMLCECALCGVRQDKGCRG